MAKSKVPVILAQGIDGFKFFVPWRGFRAAREIQGVGEEDLFFRGGGDGPPDGKSNPIERETT